MKWHAANSRKIASTSHVCRFATVAALFLMGWAVTPAIAGKLTVTADPQTYVSVWAQQDFGNDTLLTRIAKQKTSKKGKTTISLGSQAQEALLGTVVVTKMVNGLEQSNDVKLSPDGNTVASIEPFQSPFFVNLNTPLVAVLNMIPFLQQGDPFYVGEQLSVNNGSIGGVPSITIHIQSQPFPDQFDPSLIDGMPLYTGTVFVNDFSQFQPVPEPSSLLLVGSGLVGLSAFLRKQPLNRTGGTMFTGR